MRAAVLSEVNSALVIEEIPTPRPRSGEVLVQVAACGVCHTDLHVMKGEVKFPLPAVLGHEISGTIAETAPDVTQFHAGERVAATFILPCGRCAFCGQGRDDLCETFFQMNRLQGVLYDGQSRLARSGGQTLAMYSMGGLAEYAVVPATAVFRLPDGVALEDACILGCAYFTAHGAVRHQGELKPGASVAVVGTGGVGTCILQMARLFGASTIVAVDIREDKLEAARALGATHTVNAAKGDPVVQVREMLQGRGVDVAFEALGRSETVVQAVNMVCDGGRAVLVGIAPRGVTAPLEITPLVRRGIRIAGSYGGRARADMPLLIKMLAAGQIQLGHSISRRFKLAQADEAYQALARGEIVGRAIVTMGA